LEPVLVTQKDDKYLLICGERRYLAASKAGQETIPARVVNAITQKDEILAFQLIENLQREDLNHIDQANGILAFIQAKHPDKNYNLDEVMGELVNVMRTPEYASKDFSFTVNEIVKISGKSYPTLFRTISLLKLVPKIQDAIFLGTLSVSQGYLFAANLGSPDFFTIFNEIMGKPVTNAKLEKMLTEYKKAKTGTTANTKPVSIKKKVEVLQNAESFFQEKTGMYSVSDLQKYLDELKVLASLIEKQINAASQTGATVKKPPAGPRPQV
jgi:ParB-like chromosome segregation protein Spo0J